MRNGQRARLDRRAQDAQSATEYRPGTETAAPKTLSGLAVTPPYPSIQRYASGGDELGGTEADAGVTDTLRRRKGAGRPLDRVNADRFSSGFGADLSSVRLHTDGEADRIARSVQSVAFTYGRDVYFSRGSYQPGTESGDHLLAHELAHVVQGSSGRWAVSGSGVQIGKADDPAEAAADQAADQVMTHLHGGSAPDPVALGALPAATGEPIARTVRRAGLKSLVKRAFKGKKKKRGPKGRPSESKTLGGATMSQLRALSDAQQARHGSSSAPRGTEAKKPPVMDDVDFDDAKSSLDDDDDFLFNSSSEDDGMDDVKSETKEQPEGNYQLYDPDRFVDDGSELSSSEDEEDPVVVPVKSEEKKDKPEANYEKYDPDKEVDDYSEISSSEDDEEKAPVIVPVKTEEKSAGKPKPKYDDPVPLDMDDDDMSLSSSEDDEEKAPVIVPVKTEEKSGGKPAEKPKANYEFFDPDKVVDDGIDDDDISISEDSDEPVVKAPEKSSDEKKDKPKAKYDFFDPNKELDNGIDDDDDISISEDSEEPVKVVVKTPVKTPDKKAKKQPKRSDRAKNGKHRAFLTRGVAEPYANETTVASDEARKVMENAADMIRRATALLAEIQAGLPPLQALGKVNVVKTLADDIRKTGGDVDQSLALVRAYLEDRREFCRRQEFPLDKDDMLGDISGRMVRYDNEDEQKKSTVTVKDGKLYRADGELVDTGKSSTFFSGNGVEIFVASESGELHMASHKVGKYHHSSLLAGAQVSLGGEMKVTAGRIEWISNKSGHYTPSKDHLVQFLHWLGKDGMDLNGFEVKAGFGVPGGRKADEIVDGLTEHGFVDPKEGFDAVKLRAVMEAYEEQFGMGDTSVEKFLDSKGWYWIMGTMRSRNRGEFLRPRDVIKALKAQFGVPNSISLVMN